MHTFKKTVLGIRNTEGERFPSLQFRGRCLAQHEHEGNVTGDRGGLYRRKIVHELYERAEGGFILYRRVAYVGSESFIGEAKEFPSVAGVYLALLNQTDCNASVADAVIDSFLTAKVS